MNGYLHTALLITVACLWAGAASKAEEASFPVHTIGNSQLRDLPASANGKAYRLYVAVPYSYEDDPDETYPVLYLCDGYWDFTLFNGFYGNLHYDKVIPEFIIVGLGYQGDDPDYSALRREDYTPVPEPDPEDDPDGKGSGHAKAFLSVLEQDIIPFIEREYRVDSDYRVLAGSSLGGLFSLYAMYTKPDLFQAYIAASPAAAWADDWLFDYEEAFAGNGGELKARLFMTGAEKEWPEFLANIKRFNERLQTRNYPGWTYQWRLIEGEKHAGTKAESYNRGTRFAFAPRAPEE